MADHLPAVPGDNLPATTGGGLARPAEPIPLDLHPRIEFTYHPEKWFAAPVQVTMQMSSQETADIMLPVVESSPLTSDVRRIN